MRHLTVKHIVAGLSPTMKFAFFRKPIHDNPAQAPGCGHLFRYLANEQD